MYKKIEFEIESGKKDQIISTLTDLVDFPKVQMLNHTGKRYYGEVSTNSFWYTWKRTSESFLYGVPIVKGKIYENSETTTIQVVIHNYGSYAILGFGVLIFLTLTYFLINTFISKLNPGKSNILIVIGLMIFISLIMIINIFIIKKGLKKMLIEVNDILKNV